MDVGIYVRVKANPGRTGFTTGKDRSQGGREYVQVLFHDGPSFVLVSLLEPVPLETEDPLELLGQGRLGRARDLRSTLTHIRLNGRLANLIYSMETTNTDFHAYQFKPVLNFLDAPADGILIADEVGLGKTIEAGLIWTEIRSRLDARCLLVLCPAMLREKWQDELLSRFGVSADICSAGELQRRLEEYRQGRVREFALVASMQGLRPPRGWSDEQGPRNAAVELARFLDEHGAEEPLVDLLVVDEAHYMRNRETSTAQLGRLLRDVAAHVVLLSATPVHLRNRDLFSLLNLVDPETYEREDSFDQILEANGPLVAAKDLVLAGRTAAEDLVAHLGDACSHPLLANNRQLERLLDDLSGGMDLSDPVNAAGIVGRLEKVNLLGRVVTRTRKREVQEWRVVREAVPEEIPMNPLEAELYAEVTELVRDYAATRGGHEGFLAVMPQRQLASCMPAAFAAWRERAVETTLSSYEDLGVESNSPPPGPLVTELARRASALGDLAALESGDSKFQRLSKVLCQLLENRPAEKVVLFAYFHPTLKYLHRRLGHIGISSVVLTGGAGLDKHAIIRRFKDQGGPSVLLASEVASEGVDLQFASIVINYDLPWNPMKVEQRIGRVDRLGQRSPKVTVWNLFFADTIDARIHNRLYERLDIFRNALGDLEAVLGDRIRTLSVDLLTAGLSQEQQELRIEQTAMALENLRRHESELEDQAGNLVAHGDYILNEVRAARDLSRWVTDQDLWIYVRDWFSASYPNCEFRQMDTRKLEFDILLSTEARFDLAEFLRLEQLRGRTALAQNSARPVRCCFRNKPSTTPRGRVEQITQFHPLVRFVTQGIQKADSVAHPVIAVEVDRRAAGGVDVGRYVFSVDRWSLRGLRDIERLTFCVVPVSGDASLLDDDAAEKLVTAAAREGADWPGAANAVDLALAKGLAGRCLEAAQNRYEAYVRERDAENNDLADVRQRSIERHWDTQRERRRSTVAMHESSGRTALAAAVRGQIEKLDGRMQQRLLEIKAQRELRHHRKEVCLGLVNVT